MMGSLSIQSQFPLIQCSCRDLKLVSISNSKAPLKSKLRTQNFPCFSSNNDDASNSTPSSNFCIIEGPETVQDFVQMQLKEIEDNIRSRRNKIFLLMEEVRRLRVQQRLKGMEVPAESGEQENEMPDIPSSIPFLPHVSIIKLRSTFRQYFVGDSLVDTHQIYRYGTIETIDLFAVDSIAENRLFVGVNCEDTLHTPKTLKQLYLTSFSFASGIIVFGGLLAPVLELKLGLGGTSYADFIRSLHLPPQLSEVDPIVASFSGGAVGVISALMLIEVNNVEQQEKKRCKYCLGSGYLACAQCSASGFCLNIEPVSVNGYTGKNRLIAPTPQRCTNCSGTGKVMCTTCLCTGMAMASEHDPRIDPFD